MSSGKIKWLPAPGKIAVKLVGESEFVGETKLILAPPTRYNPRTTGIVVAVYEGFKNDADKDVEPWFDIGDKVIFGQHSGIEVEYGRNEKVIILREAEILVKVELENEEDIEKLGVAGTAFDDLEG